MTMMTTEIKKINNTIMIDENNKNIIIDLSYLPEDNWNIALNAPNQNIEMNFKSLKIRTEFDIDLQTKGRILLNCSEEELAKYDAELKKDII